MFYAENAKSVSILCKAGKLWIRVPVQQVFASLKSDADVLCQNVYCFNLFIC